MKQTKETATLGLHMLKSQCMRQPEFDEANEGDGNNTGPTHAEASVHERQPEFDEVNEGDGNNTGPTHAEESVHELSLIHI